tara:strand:- start:860 stop:1249 length:390 start_codon:yes stop_codon:yes gene_type:complete
MSLFPKLKWAQDSKNIFLTVCENDLKNVNYEVKNNSFSFSAEKDNNKYQFKLNLLQEIKQDDLKKNLKELNCFFEFVKVKEEWWDFLIQEKKLPNLEVDWNKWKYENESDDELYNYNIPDNFEELLKQN